MSKLKKHDFTGRETGEVEVASALLESAAHSQMVKDYIIAIRENKRQWSACTRGRSEVNHSTQKPHKQKGTGKARQGRLSSPQYKGGGVVFGPKPKFDQHVRINRKERRQVMRHLIAQMVQEGKVVVLDDSLEAPKTKVVAHFLKNVGIKGRTLFLGEGKSEAVEGEGKSEVSVRSTAHVPLMKSVKNLQKVDFRLCRNVSGYDLLIASALVITEPALQELTEWLAD